MKSIKIKLFLNFLVYLVLFLSILISLNSILLKKYFIYQETISTTEFFNDIDATYNGFDSVNHDLINEQKLKFGRSVMIFSGELDLIFDSKFFMFSGEELRSYLDKLPKTNSPTAYYGKLIKENREEIIKNGYRAYNTHNRDNELIFWINQLNNGDYFIVLLATDNFKDSIALINNFTIFLSVILGIVTSIFLYLFAGKLTKPIIELSQLSVQISKQNFGSTFTSAREDELGILGRNINQISEKLKESLDELKDELKRKEEINLIRKNFISSVSHELKTPIGLIRGCSEILKYNILQDERKKKEYFANMVQETERMNLLVNDMLQISYMDSGSFLINKSEFFMDELIEEIIAKYTHKFDAQEAKVNKIIIENIKVNGDKTRIFQVIVNYLENALRHLDAKKFIEIKMESLNNKIRVSIFNSGKTIPQNDIENIWHTFYKTDKAHSRASGNSGLGLAIVKSIVESHEGICGVHNEETGVRFFFEI